MRSSRHADHGKRTIGESPWRITRLYVILSLFWIVFSSALLSEFHLDGVATAWIELAKGTFWVLASAALLHVLVFRQIRQIKRSERETREKLSAGEEIGQFGTAEWIPSTGERVWSVGMFRVWGADLSAGIPSQEWMLERVHPDDKALFSQRLEEMRIGQQVDPIEIRIRRPDGAERLLRVVTRYEEETGKPPRSISTTQDVTELSVASRDARRSESLLRAVLESSAEGLIVVHWETRRILVWNHRYADLMGVSEEVLQTGDARAGRSSLLQSVTAPDRVDAWMEELYLQQEAACTDLIEMVDGRVIERTTAPVYLDGAPTARIWGYRDVTARIRSEEEVRRREHHLRVSQEIAKLGSFEWDLQRDEVHWSDELFQIYGYEPFTGPVPRDFARERRHPEDLQRLEDSLQEALRTGRSGPVMFRIIRPDGDLRWLRASGEFVEHEPGRKILLGIVQDVTERERSAEALRIAEERYRAAFEQAAVGIAEVGADYRMLSVNPQLSSALGYAHDELVGMSLEDLSHPEDVGKQRGQLQALLSGAQQSSSSEVRFRRKDGSWMWAEVTVAGIQTDGAIGYLVAVVQDVTERKAMERERATLAHEVGLLLESSGTGLIALDRDGVCRLANRAASEILGCRVEQLLGVNIYDLVQDVSRGSAEDSPDPFAQDSGARLYNRNFRRRNGMLIPCDVTITPIDQDGTDLVRAVSFVDVTERNLLEAQLERAERLSSLGRLAASIAHEMNNVLMGILPFAEIVSRGGEGRIASAGDQIRQSVQRGRSVTQEILRFTRATPPEKKKFAAAEWILGLAPELEELVSSRAAWTLDVAEQGLWIEADPTQLEQVVSNLVMNARDAVADHEGNVSLTLERATRRASFPFGDLPAIDHDWVHLTVRDTGAGMDGETLRQIFEPFFTTKRGGTGLGLPIAQKMISGNDGILFVESTPGMGTAFHVFVPGAENSAATGGAAVTDQGDLPSRILLVEDDETVALGLIAGLQYEGVEVRLVGTGEAAIEALAERPEAMILDVGLPDMDGTAVCEVALERWPDLPIVFSTGHGDASRLGRFLERPNVRFLMKPYSFEELREAIVAVRKSD